MSGGFQKKGKIFKMASIRGDSGQFFGGDSGHISRCPVSPHADGSISESGIGSS